MQTTKAKSNGEVKSDGKERQKWVTKVRIKRVKHSGVERENEREWYTFMLYYLTETNALAARGWRGSVFRR